MTPRYIQWTILGVLYQTRRNVQLVHKGLICTIEMDERIDQMLFHYKAWIEDAIKCCVAIRDQIKKQNLMRFTMHRLTYSPCLMRIG